MTLTRTGAELELWTPPAGLAEKDVGRAVCSFLDTATTSFGRATHYNSRLEQQKAELAAHEALMDMSRDVYSVLLALPGVTDRSVQVGMKRLLSTPRNGVSEFLSPANEREILYHMIQALPAQRMLKLLDAFRIGSEELNLKRANNARTRKLILRTVLTSPRLQLWAVKYRTKVSRALIHAWGRRLASIIREILKRDQRLWSAKEQGIVGQHVLRYAKENGTTALECVQFVFGVRDRLTLPLLKAYEGAKNDLTAGKKLPPEVLEGIRSTFHSSVPKEEILKLTKNAMSQGQRMAVQKRAKAAGVEVEWDPMTQDAVKLYLYAFECGLTDPRVVEAMQTKAKKAAEMFPAHYNRVGIVVDASRSMIGDEETQPLRPMATALAMRDMLMHVGEHGTVSYCGGDLGEGPLHETTLVGPMGDTALADSFVSVLNTEEMPDAVFVISDGYENAPAGRFAEVLDQVRQLGIDTPVYHLNPVFAAETGRVKELAPNEGVPTLPVQKPAQLGTTFLRGLIEAEPLRGINALLRMALSAGPTETRKLLQ